MRIALTMAAVTLLSAGRAPNAKAQGSGRTDAPGPTLVAETPHFALYSDPWINLHHFLYQWSRDEEGIATGRDHVPVPERSTLDGLPESERRAWEETITFYRDSAAALSHFDDQMLLEREDLIALGGDPAATPPDGIPGIASALAMAMPIYQKRWWPDHDRANRAWIAGVVSLLERHEATYVDVTERVYGARWPSEPIRVDVSAYANTAAGYTAEGHTVIYSTDPGNQDLYAFETLVHEVQHTRPVGRTGRQRLYAAFEAAGAEPPRNLWHGLIFGTAGAFVQSVAEVEGLPPYEPYWIRGDFLSFDGWNDVVIAVQEFWAPVVRGESSPDAGFAGLIAYFDER
jgi:hypothetical protein